MRWPPHSSSSMPSRFPTDVAARLRALLVLLLLLAGVACGRRGARDDVPTRVVIAPGTTLRAAADSLAARRIIGQPRLFAWYARLKGHDRGLKAGTYVLKRGMPWGDLVDALVGGKGLVQTITVPEGWNLNNIIPQLARVLEVPLDSVDAAMRDTALLHRLDVPTGTLEGYLFPETYTFPPGTTARAAVGTMVDAFEQRWEAAWNARLDTLAMSRHDVMALASIIEKEARRPEERPVISAVYHNRLKKGMRLQADPTVQYALGKHVARVMYRDLAVESPYNTYRNAGLPPGPIASPGLPSIRAALYPASVPYLFFVAHPDGHHEFRTTFQEHAIAVAAMRRLRDSAVRPPSPATSAPAPVTAPGPSPRR
jgi:UPF0755 protein